MIHVGVSKQEECIKLEKCSFNRDYSTEDISGECPEGMCCLSDAPDELSSTLDVERICEVSNAVFKAKNCQSRCGLSTDPGR